MPYLFDLHVNPLAAALSRLVRWTAVGFSVDERRLMAEPFASRMYGLPPIDYLGWDLVFLRRKSVAEVRVVFSEREHISLGPRRAGHLIVLYAAKEGVIAEIYNGSQFRLGDPDDEIAVVDIPGFDELVDGRVDGQHSWRGEGIPPLPDEEVRHAFSLDAGEVIDDDFDVRAPLNVGSFDDPLTSLDGGEPPKDNGGEGGGGSGGAGDGAGGGDAGGPRPGGGGVRELLEHQVLFSTDANLYNDILDQA